MLTKEALYSSLDNFPSVRSRMEYTSRLREARMLVVDPEAGKHITLSEAMLFDDEDESASALRVTEGLNRRLSVI